MKKLSHIRILALIGACCITALVMVNGCSLASPDHVMPAETAQADTNN